MCTSGMLVACIAEKNSGRSAWCNYEKFRKKKKRWLISIIYICPYYMHVCAVMQLHLRIACHWDAFTRVVV